MTRAQRNANVFIVVVPFLAFLAAIPLLWNSVIDESDLAIMAGMYVFTGLGIAVGYHRLLTHRSFQTFKPVEYLLAIAGSMAIQGHVIDWVADHRKHHAHTDEEGDPHSPHVGNEPGVRGAAKGLFHAHVGWLMVEHGQADRKKYAKDLVEDPGMRAISRGFLWLLLASLAIPFGLGYAIDGTLAGALTALLWGGFARIFMLHHVTWSINSICHFFGSRRFPTDDHSTNVFWLALPSFGEAWHHNHHAFPRSADNGLRWWEVDVAGLTIRAMRRLGLAWNVVTIPRERQLERQLEPAPGA